jgi:hypothetical protein
MRLWDWLVVCGRMLAKVRYINRIKRKIEREIKPWERHW